MMSSNEKDQVRERVRRFIEIWSVGDPDGLEEVLHPDFVRNLNGPMQTVDYSTGIKQVHGLDEVRKYVREERAALPGGEETLAILVDGDWAACLYREWGENRGEFMKLPPTGQFIEFEGVEIFRLKDGKIIEAWSSNMWLETYRQLGWKLVVEEGVPRFDRIEADG